jgi:hypothetical protein
MPMGSCGTSWRGEFGITPTHCAYHFEEAVGQEFMAALVRSGVAPDQTR